ncbi:hypothetical protein WICMUC_001019 [Wickerhamomyces mucosus]|uniref:Peptidase S8/S53 domain-containing protein n=1 Tax=Wickerhamomyces mucosus TaxID=1378264 RepID=A0A9P8THV6_9ASCO|nr:hypothetical protein WICMUC_001019 [Wickerhamomyces mucosus]
MNLKYLIASLLFQLSINASYFVQLKKPATLDKLLTSDDQIEAENHIRPFVKQIFSFGSFEGFSGNFTKDIIKRLFSSPYVADIVPDYTVRINDYETETNLPVFLDYETDFNSPRHLARLSRHSKLPSNQSVNYYYDPKYKGENVNAYIIDTGIYKEHPEFEGRAISGADFTFEGPGDFNGHGTHVAGIIGSRTFGVAKDVTLVEVKALDRLGQGSLTTVIAALEFAVNHRKENNVSGVVNLSLGAIKNNILNQAISVAVSSGLVVVVAAGNANIDSCLVSPASAPEAITVGAIDDRTDSIAGFSNWGACVDIFASGVLVQSLNNQDINKPTILSGTSMSSPSITGLTSILLQQGITAANIQPKLIEMSTNDIINSKSLATKPLTPNRVAFNSVFKSDDLYPLEEDIDKYNFRKILQS